MTTSTLDRALAAISNGRSHTAQWRKTTGASAYTAGRWYDLTACAGSPPANSWGATANALAFTCNDTVGDGASLTSINHGGNRAPFNKYAVQTAGITNAATGAPSMLMLVDILMGWAGVDMDSASAQNLTSAQTVTVDDSSGLRITYASDWKGYTQVRFSTTGTLPTGLVANTDYWTKRINGTTARVATSLDNAIANTVIPYTDAGTGTHTMTVRMPRYADGEGVMPLLIEKLSASGATAHNCTLTYTNQAGVDSRSTGAVACTPSAIVGHINITGTATNNVGPFFPLQSGDSGVRSIQTLQLSAASGSGQGVVVLVKPLVTLALGSVNVLAEKNLITGMPEMPRILSGACLGHLLYAGAAVATSTGFSGQLTSIWE